MGYKLTYRALQECASIRIAKHIWDDALAYLKKTGDVDGWRVMIYGA